MLLAHCFGPTPNARPYTKDQTRWLGCFYVFLINDSFEITISIVGVIFISHSFMCDICRSKPCIPIGVENYIYFYYKCDSFYISSTTSIFWFTIWFDCHCKFLVTIQNIFAISKTYFQQLFQICLFYNNYPISNNSPKIMIKNLQNFN
jgi:hypothetical protein